MDNERIERIAQNLTAKEIVLPTIEEAYEMLKWEIERKLPAKVFGHSLKDKGNRIEGEIKIKMGEAMFFANAEVHAGNPGFQNFEVHIPPLMVRADGVRIGN